jgi:hypothetical protein
MSSDDDQAAASQSRADRVSWAMACAANYPDDDLDGLLVTFADGERLFVSADDARALHADHPTPGRHD